MINVTVYQNGDVLGDIGKIIGYIGQKYSEDINIVHPLFVGSDGITGAEYYLEYKYNNTIYREKLDGNNNVKVLLDCEREGYLQCQLVAIDILNGNMIFKSNPWNFLVSISPTLEPSHYPCSAFMYNFKDDFDFHHRYHNGHFHNCYVPPIHNCGCNEDKENFNAYEAYTKLYNELQDEEKIRFNETKQLYEDIMRIKEILHIDDPKSSILNADKLTQPGHYLASVGSIGFPKDNVEYDVIVTKLENILNQQALDENGEYSLRKGKFNENGEIEWESWGINITNPQPDPDYPELIVPDKPPVDPTPPEKKEPKNLIENGDMSDVSNLSVYKDNNSNSNISFEIKDNTIVLKWVTAWTDQPLIQSINGDNRKEKVNFIAGHTYYLMAKVKSDVESKVALSVGYGVEDSTELTHPKLPAITIEPDTWTTIDYTFTIPENIIESDNNIRLVSQKYPSTLYIDDIELYDCTEYPEILDKDDNVTSDDIEIIERG